jgi:hypothetical protein
MMHLGGTLPWLRADLCGPVLASLDYQQSPKLGDDFSPAFSYCMNETCSILEADMTTLSTLYKPCAMHIPFANKREEFIARLLPRRCMLFSVGLVLAGMSIPALMALQILPVTLLLGFLALALIAAGGVLVFFYCGEI